MLQTPEEELKIIGHCMLCGEPIYKNDRHEIFFVALVHSACVEEIEKED